MEQDTGTSRTVEEDQSSSSIGRAAASRKDASSTSTSSGELNGSAVPEARRGSKQSQKEAVWSFLSSLTPEERHFVQKEMSKRYMEKQSLKIEGKEVNMWEYVKNLAEQQERYQAGLDRWTNDSTPVRERLAAMPLQEIWGGRDHMQLWPEQAKALDLQGILVASLARICDQLLHQTGKGWRKTRIGTGEVVKPRPFIGYRFGGGSRDLCYGIFARAVRAQQLLGRKWAGQDPETVLESSQFYEDILRIAPIIELTAMVMPLRNLPLDELRREWRDRAMDCVKSQEAGPVAQQEVERLYEVMDPKKLVEAEAPWMTPDGQVRANTQLLFTTRRDSAVIVEAISPGPVREKKAMWLGVYKDPSGGLARSVFGTLLGQQAVNEGGRRSVGLGFLYLTNGFSLEEEPYDPMPSRKANPLDAMREVLMKPASEVFKMVPKRTRGVRLVLNGVQRAQAQRE